MPFFLLLFFCLTSYASLCLYTSPLLHHTLFPSFSSLVSCFHHPEFFICTSSSLPLLSSHIPTSYPSPIFSHLFLLPHLAVCLLPSFLHILPVSSPPVVPQLSGHPVPPHLPTTSAALPCQTVPTSPEGWAFAAHSTQASSGVLGTSRAPPTLADPRPRHCHMAIARPGGHTVPQGFSASSPPSLYAGEWKERQEHGITGMTTNSDHTLWLGL